MNFAIIKPDSPDQNYDPANVTVFLAGSIDNGKATLWAQDVQQALSDLDNVTLFNPRRDVWLPDLEQRAREPIFKQQVDWELDRLDECDIPFFYFEAGSISPITLQEIGYVIGSRTTITIAGEIATDSAFADAALPVVCCPDGFWRKGNVEIMCERYQIDVHNELETAIGALRKRIEEFSK